jgi:hypothetical protein
MPYKCCLVMGEIEMGGIKSLDKRVVFLVGVLVLLDAVSTYLCTLVYPVELEFNYVLRHLLIVYGHVGLLLYAPLEFVALTLLLSVYSKLLRKLGVKDTFKYCVVIIATLSIFIAMNFIGFIYAVVK